MQRDFVVHSLRRTMLPGLGPLGVDALTIMKIAGQSSIAISQGYAHDPSPITRLRVNEVRIELA
jgi:hypothetical protein